MAQEQQRLLMGEMCHRVKNLFAVAGAIVSISARSSHAKSSHAKSSNSDSPSITVSGHESDVLDDIRARLSSLARAHAMMMVDRSQGAEDQNSLSLVALIQRILAPYEADGRVMIGGNDCSVSGRAIPYLSLLLHELATNAAKFGSLSVGSGRLDVRVASDDDLVRLVWQETGGPAPAIGGPGGFGSRLEQSVMGALSAMIERNWRPTGLAATIAMPKAILTA
jgi:two-component sensor histidine kinase